MMTSDRKRYDEPSVGGGVTPGAGASVRLAALRGGVEPEAVNTIL